MTTFPGGQYPSLGELTFGIEWEFLVHVDAINMTQEEKAALAARMGLFPNELARRIAGVIKEQLERLQLEHPIEVTRKLPDRRAYASENERNYQAWIAKADGTVAAPGPDGPLYAGMEVVTPVLSNVDHSFDECWRVSEKLQVWQLATFNESCGLHVHVGHGERGFDLLTVQKLFSLLFLGGESITNLLHPSHRQNNPYCRDLSTYSDIARSPYRDRTITGRAPPEWYNSCFPEGYPEADQRTRTILERIWSAKTMREFYRMSIADKRLAISFVNLSGTVPNRPPTVEFRKAECIMYDNSDVNFTVMWPKVCMSLLAFAVDADPAEFERVIKETHHALLATTNYERIRVFLTALKVDEETVNGLAERAQTLSLSQGY